VLGRHPFPISQVKSFNSTQTETSVRIGRSELPVGGGELLWDLRGEGNLREKEASRLRSQTVIWTITQCGNQGNKQCQKFSGDPFEKEFGEGGADKKKKR